MNKTYIFSFILLYTGMGYIPLSCSMEKKEQLKAISHDANHSYSHRYKLPHPPSLFNRWFRKPMGYYSQKPILGPEGLVRYEKVAPTPANVPYMAVYEPLFTKRTRGVVRFLAGFASVVAIGALGSDEQYSGTSILYHGKYIIAWVSSLALSWAAIERGQKHDLSLPLGMALGCLTIVCGQKFMFK